MKISFIIPVFNNSKTIVALANELRKTAEENTWEFESIFVDDSSSDDSVSVIKNNTDEKCIGIKLLANQGQSTALLVGMQYATGEFFVTLDADLQDKPSFIPLLINAFDEKTDVVFSARSGQYEQKRKLVSARIFKYLLHILSNKRLPVNACLFFAIRQQSARKLLRFSGARPYLLAAIAKCRLHCSSVLYERPVNEHGPGSYNFFKRWKVAYKGILNFFLLKEKEIDFSLIELIKTPPGFSKRERS